MDLFGRVKSHGVSLSRHLCTCMCVHVRVCFAFLLCVAISPVGKFLACYYKDMTQCTRECDREPVFFMLFFPPSPTAFSIWPVGFTINRRLENTQTLSAVFDCLSAGLHWAYLVDIVKLLYPECGGR